MCFRFLEEVCKEKGFQRIALMVNKKNWDAIQVYQKIGMRIAKNVSYDCGKKYFEESYIFTKEIQ